MSAVRLALLAAMLLPALAGRAAPPKEVGLLPGDKKPLLIRQEERNPFAKKEEKTEIIPVEDDSASEESQIRAVLLQLRVVGRINGSDGRKVLLDDLILEAGKTLPPVIPNQTETLKVHAIYDSAVEIVWLEADPATDPRRLFIPINMKPEVSRALAARSVNSGEKSVLVPDVITNAPSPPTNAAADR